MLITVCAYKLYLYGSDSNTLYICMAVIQIHCMCEVVIFQHHSIKAFILDSTFNESV